MKLESLKALALEAKARSERATEGPWQPVSGMYIIVGPAKNSIVASTSLGRYKISSTETRNAITDQIFIASARTDVPALADAVLELIKKLEEK